MENTIRLHQKQGEIFLNQKRHRVVVAGRKFGKTTLALAELLRSALGEQKRFNVYIAPTYKMAKMSLWNDAIVKFLDPQLIQSKNETELNITLINNTRIELYGADDPERLRGGNWDFVVLDEFQDFKTSAWEYIIEPNLLATKGRTLKLGTPKGKKNILYNEYSVNNPDYQPFHFTSYDNPYVDKNVLERTRQRLISEGKEDVWRQEYLAEFITLANQIYNNFSRDLHVKEIKIGEGSFGLSIDRGIENPSAVLFFYIYTKDGDWRLHVFDEIYQNRLTTQDLVDRIKLKMGDRDFVYQTVDPSAKDFYTSANQLGLYLRPPKREGADESFVLDGISRVKHWLGKSPLDGEPRLTIHPRCKNLIEEIEEYVWEENLGETRERPRKVNDHAVDALRYFIVHFEQGINPQGTKEEEIINLLPQEDYFKDGFY